MKYFIKPEKEIFSKIDSNFLQSWVTEVNTNFTSSKKIDIESLNTDRKSYTCFNYYGSSIASAIKLDHFEKALQFSKSQFRKAKVIDLGCADGMFLPSLSQYFSKVVAIDHGEDFINNATQVVQSTGLKNVSLYCNRNQSLEAIAKQINDPVDIIFSLEVLEHVGKKESMYQDKLDFLKDASNLLKDNGIFIISVPRMVGLSFFLQRLGIRLMRIHTEPISWSDFLKAVFLSNTNGLEKSWWAGGHLGFNHNKFENKIRSDFKIVTKKKGLFQVFYILKKLH